MAIQMSVQQYIWYCVEMHETHVGTCMYMWRSQLKNATSGGTTGVHPLWARQVVPSGLLRLHTAARSADSTRAFPAQRCLNNPNISTSSRKIMKHHVKIHIKVSVWLNIRICCSSVWSLAVWVISAKCIASEARSASTSFTHVCTEKIDNEAKPSGAQRMK